MNILKRIKTDIPKVYVYIAALLFSAAVIIQISSRNENPSLIVYIRHILLFTTVYLLWAVCIDFINALIQPFKTGTSVFIQVLERVVSTVILAFTNLCISNFIYYSFLIIFMGVSISDAYLDFEPYIFKSFAIRIIDIIIIGLILKLINAFQSLQKQKLRVVSLENQLHISQLETLRNQLDPHFLFNTLHTLNTLIGYDDKKAKSMVIKVTKLLRKILEKKDKQFIPFKEELEYFSNYLEIEEERFHDRFEFFMDIDEKTKVIMVPTLILQPLIENAFKHGIAQIEGKGEIKLKTTLKDNVFLIELSNTIPNNHLTIVANSTKVGLTNLISRLQQVYNDDYIFTTKKVQDKFVATIKINQKN